MEMEMGISTKWTDIFMRALTGVAVFMCAVGFVVPAYSVESGSVDWAIVFAGIGISGACALCLLISNTAAANAPVVFAGKKYIAVLICVAVCVGGAFVSMHAMHLGWEVFSSLVGSRYKLPSDDEMNYAFAFVAFAKPAVNWVIHAMEDIKFQRQLAESDKDREERLKREQRLAESDASRRRREEAESRRSQFRAVPKMALAATAAFGIPAAANAESLESPAFPLVESTHAAPASTESEAHAAHGWKGPRDQEKWNRFKECVAAGMTEQKEIAGLVGIPTTTAHNWWKRYHAGAPEAVSA